jgi:PPM family protein phosphatase
MAYLVELGFAAKTDAGLVRSHNEDSIEVSLVHGLAILADGMGGYNAGEVASGIATAVVKELLEDQLQNQLEDGRKHDKYLHASIVEAIQHANDAIIKTARKESQYSGMGTTLVLALFYHDKVTVAHVGDSRAYRFRHARLEQITRDHSLVQEQIDAGLLTPEWAQFSNNKNLITRAVGIDYEIDVEIHDHVIEVGDIYLLCSDGLSDMLSSQEISDILNSLDSSLEMACDTLVYKANDNGGRDNISIILIKVQAIEVETEGLFGRILSWIK